MYETFAQILATILVLLGGTFGTEGDSEPADGASAPETTAYPAVVYADVLHVIDGDTIDVSIAGEEERIRYIGIDAPEENPGGTPECYASAASSANGALVSGTTVRLEADEERRDEYGRMLRYVYVEDPDGEVFVNERLLEAGYARLLFIPPNTREYGAFLDIRDAARAENRGLWGACAE